MNDEREQDETTRPAVEVSFATKAGIVGLPGALTLGVNALAHGGLAPVGLTGFALVCLAANSPYLAEKAGQSRECLLWLAHHEKWLDRLDRATDGYFSRQIAALAEARPDLFARAARPALQGKDDEDDEEQPLETRAYPQQPVPVYQRPAARTMQQEEALVSRVVQPLRLSQEPDDLQPLRRAPAGLFLFSQVLTDFTPTLSRLYLGTLADGTQVFCRAEDLCHVALAGPTRGGKSSLMRMLLAQLCKAGASVLILNPHYSRYLLDKQEDWTPFEPYLLDDPMACRSYEVIGQYLQRIATEILPKRLDRFAHSLPVGRPTFIALDELPSIIKHVPAASGYLDDLLREGAKVGLFLIVASHDFLVKTIAPSGSGGAVRECYRSAFYAGGDPTTAKVLLDTTVDQFPETRLGRGTILLRNWVVCQEARLAFVPLVDNQALYQLLGPSTYVPTQALPAAEMELADRRTAVPPSLPVSRSSVPAVAASPRYHSHGVGPESVVLRRRARAERLRGVGAQAAVREQAQPSSLAATKPTNPEEHLSEDERTVLQAYREGRKSGNAIAAVTAMPATRVNKCLNSLSAQGLIDWRPKQ